MFRGDNATCNGCLTHREKWAGKNTQRVKEFWQKYHSENRDTIKEKKTVYNPIEVDCEVCRCKVKKNKWTRHVQAEKHSSAAERGGGDGNKDWGIWWGAKGRLN